MAMNGLLGVVTPDGRSLLLYNSDLEESRDCTGRFEQVQTPKHRSWLKLIEWALSRMAGTFPRHSGVTPVDELRAPMLKGIRH